MLRLQSNWNLGKNTTQLYYYRFKIKGQRQAVTEEDEFLKKCNGYWSLSSTFMESVLMDINVHIRCHFCLDVHVQFKKYEVSIYGKL